MRVSEVRARARTSMSVRMRASTFLRIPSDLSRPIDWGTSLRHTCPIWEIDRERGGHSLHGALPPRAQTGTKNRIMIEVLRSDAAETTRTAHAHLLPCEIQYNGPQLVSAYFKPTTGKRSQEAAFRGRALKGTVLPLPAGYAGAVIADTKQADVADGEERRWLHRSTIESFTLWKHDMVPNEDEPLLKCARWIEIADVLHGDHCDDEAADEAAQ